MSSWAHSNVIIVQTNTPTSDYNDDLVEEYYIQKQWAQITERTFWLCKVMWNAKVSLDAMKTEEKYMAYHLLVPPMIEGYVS